MSQNFYYVPEERAIGRLEHSGGSYHHAQIYRDGEWVPVYAYELVHNARKIDREEAIKEIGLAALEKK